MTDPTFEIPGSKRRLDSNDLLMLDAKPVPYLRDPSMDSVQITVMLPSDPAAGDPVIPMTRDVLRAARRPSQVDVQNVIDFANDNGLTVVDPDRPPRMVVLRGTVSNVAAAFGTNVELWHEPWPRPNEQISSQQNEGHTFRRRSMTELKVPPALRGTVQGVFGIDDRKEARMQMHIQLLPPEPPRTFLQEAVQGDTKETVQQDATANTSEDSPGRTVDDLARMYNFPDEKPDGPQQTIAILSLGGRLDSAEFARYCDSIKIKPEVIEVSVDCELPEPGAVPDEDAEVALDVYIISALAPSARIVIYYAENTSQGFLNGLARAIYSDDPAASIINISWGDNEQSWTIQAMRAIDELLADAKALGITVCCASGDMGSSDGAPDGCPHVDFPASSPHVLSCGGTMQATNSSAEVVWNEPESGLGSGGGQSNYFRKPDWQRDRMGDTELDKLTMRGVPDVAGPADPSNGIVISISGQKVLVGGTSAVAPLWAGLVARINTNLENPVGYLNPRLYHNDSSDAFIDIKEGTNGAWDAKPGWDACTGLGRPDGEALLRVLKK